MKFPEKIQSADTEALLVVNGSHNETLDFIMYWASDKFIWIPLYLVLAIFIFRIMGKQIVPVLIAIALLITASDQISTRVFKKNFKRLRPCNDPELADKIHRVNDKCGGSYGFVSSHGSNTMALAVFLSLILGRNRKGLIIVLFSWAVFVSLSRVYLGVHYPLDILGGWLLGALLAYVFYRVYRQYKIKYA